MHVIVLGSAAGGGVPQWNSGGLSCVAARAGKVLARTQCSIAVSPDGERWVLINASPDLRHQVNATRALHPVALRGSPIAAVILTGGEIDAIAGLLTMRERHSFALHATPQVLALLAANPIFSALAPAMVPRRAMALGAWFDLVGLRIEPFAVPGKVPLFAESDGADPGRADDGETVGLAISAPGSGTLVFIPGCAALNDAVRARIAQASLLMFDGTLYRDDEMILAGAGPKTGARMGHMSLDGPAGTLANLRGIAPPRRVLIHLNNTNPVLLPDSPERHHVQREGWIVAEDGMEFSL